MLALWIMLSSFALADVKAKTRVTASGATVETTTLLKGARLRQEPVATNDEPQIIRIYQCDLKRVLLVNPKSQTYRAIALDYAGEAQESSAPSRPARTSRSGTVVTLTTAVADTGEEREIAGRTARGINVETVADTSDASCSTARKVRLRSQGWYATIPGINASCADPNLAGLRLRPAEPECSDRVSFRMKGSLPQGLPLLIESTLATSEGEVSMKQELVGITEVEGLEDALFDAPAGYRLVTTQEELLASEVKVESEATKAGPGLQRPDRATRTGEPRPELTRVCVLPPTGIEPEQVAGAQLRLGAFLNRQGLQAVTVTPGEKQGACRFNVAVEKVSKGKPRFTYRVQETAKPGKAMAGTMTVTPGETEDQLWENLAKAIATKLPKQNPK